MTDDDLDLVEEQRLVDAIGRRYDCFLFVAAKNKTEGPRGGIITTRQSYDGERLRVIGLCHMLASRISAEIDAEMEHDD